MKNFLEIDREKIDAYINYEHIKIDNEGIKKNIKGLLGIYIGVTIIIGVYGLLNIMIISFMILSSILLVFYTKKILLDESQLIKNWALYRGVFSIIISLLLLAGSFSTLYKLNLNKLIFIAMICIYLISILYLIISKIKQIEKGYFHKKSQTIKNAGYFFAGLGILISRYFIANLNDRDTLFAFTIILYIMSLALLAGIHNVLKYLLINRKT
ncbi:hypothetical protein [Vallitalea maricola]|uniref:hypothetical protein n=1 Tax=Vallitalea maricola TaxID=3074433 RepID=UPI0030DD0047